MSQSEITEYLEQGSMRILLNKLGYWASAFAIATMAATSLALAQDKPIIHDAEHYILLNQHGEKWAAEDTAIDTKLAAIEQRNNGKKPNIIYILIDDVGMGELGSPVLNNVRGYRTPNINKFATQGLAFSRMYAEPSCTPTRAAFLTGRLPIRSHMLEPKVVPPEGSGLNPHFPDSADSMARMPLLGARDNPHRP